MNTGFSNDGALKAVKLTAKFVWWCLTALIAVVGFIFSGIKSYRARQARKAAEAAANAPIAANAGIAADAVTAATPENPAPAEPSRTE